MDKGCNLIINKMIIFDIQIRNFAELFINALIV